jgi:hypothetical protein
MLPWFYLQVVHRSGRENFASMLMMYHAHELKQLVDAQSNRMWVEQVQLVTPPRQQPIHLAYGTTDDGRDCSRSPRRVVLSRLPGGQRDRLFTERRS